MLTDLAIRKAKAKDKDYKLSDSGGLYLFVAKTGRLSWRLKYRFSGKERRLILGSYPAVSLSAARDLRDAAKKHLAEGRDPGVEAQKEKVQRAAAAASNFESIARGWYDLQRPRWAKVHAGDVIRSMEKEVFPWLGRLPIKDIDEPLVLTVLRKIERRGAIETAHRVRQRISAVFVHAIAEGVATRDPAAVVTKSLKQVPKSKKRPALVSLVALQDMLRKTEGEPASPVTKLGSRFMALTAQRPGMIRSLPWNELESIDWDSDEPCPAALWRVPASRMKLILELKSDDAFDHLVPLPQQAVDVLRAMRRLTGLGPLVFPSSRNSHVAMSENTVNYFYNRCGYQGRHVPHGWRASFSTIMNEWAERAGNAGDRHVIDLMLAHIPEGVSGSESAYNRAAYMERRRELANVWANMLMDGLAKPQTILFGPRR